MTTFTKDYEQKLLEHNALNKMHLEKQQFKNKASLNKINALFKNTIENYIEIGKELIKLKTEIKNLTGEEQEIAKENYHHMHTWWGYGTQKTNMFIKISQDKNIVKYIDKMPISYMTLNLIVGKTEAEIQELIHCNMSAFTTFNKVETFVNKKLPCDMPPREKVKPVLEDFM